MPDWTLVIREGSNAGEEFPVDGEVVLGREHGSASLVLDDPGVSRRHASVRAAGGAITVEDLGSSNGTYVNGARIAGEARLAEGDEVSLGGTVITIRPAPRSQPAPSPGMAKGRLAPRPDEESNIPALAAVFLGPLSIFLLLFSTGGGFFVSLPCAIGAVILGTIGIRKADREGGGHRALARIGRITGIVGAALSLLALAAFIVISIALDVTEQSLDSLDGIIDAVSDEIEGVEVPEQP